jgi:hypothetical protein
MSDLYLIIPHQKQLLPDVANPEVIVTAMPAALSLQNSVFAGLKDSEDWLAKCDQIVAIGLHPLPTEDCADFCLDLLAKLPCETMIYCDPTGRWISSTDFKEVLADKPTPWHLTAIQKITGSTFLTTHGLNLMGFKEIMLDRLSARENEALLDYFLEAYPDPMAWNEDFRFMQAERKYRLALVDSPWKPEHPLHSKNGAWKITGLL